MPTGHFIWSFDAHINDLHFPDPGFGIKYVDDSSAAHSCKNPGDETIQECEDYMNDWSIKTSYEKQS